MRTFIVLVLFCAPVVAQDLPWTFEQRLSALEMKVGDILNRVQRIEGGKPVRVMVDGRWYIKAADGSIRECVECNQEVAVKTTTIRVVETPVSVVYAPIVEPIPVVQTVPIGVVPAKVTYRVGLLRMRSDEVYADGTIIRRGPLGGIRSIERIR